MITVWGMASSGNCWKVATILRLTGHGFDWIETDSTNGATRTSVFLEINPNGKVPVLRLDDGEIVTESNAILTHFAEGTPWLPQAGLPRTRVMEWLFFEQYSHEPYIAVARAILHLARTADSNRERLLECHARGAAALGVMERRLVAAPFLTDAGPTVADLALFAYTHVAHQGGFDLLPYPGITAWIDRVAALPGITPLD